MSDELTLIEGARELGIPLTPTQAQSLLRLLDELDDWNQRMNLTAIRRRALQITKHLLDSLSVQPYLSGNRIADVGTGAGFPGLPLAIVDPDRSFTLIDSTAKKIRFVEHVVGLLGLANVEAIHARAEDLRPRPRFDTVLSRAVGPIDRFVAWSGHLLARGGRLLAMKGRFPAAELGTLPSGWKLVGVHRLTVPGLDEERHLVELCRSHEKLDA